MGAVGGAGVNVLLIASHAIAEYDDIRMFTDLGIDVFCPGGNENPSVPREDKRPGIPNAPYHADLADACRETRERHGSEMLPDFGNAVDWAKADLPQPVIDWADAIIIHHFPEIWLVPQWARLRDKRVIWRTCGQSTPPLEELLTPLAEDGLEIVRYSPKEHEYFTSVGSFAGEDEMIRFGKYPADYGPWIGDDLSVGNVTQDMVGRSIATNLGFWMAATDGLPAKPAGPSSQFLGGVGQLGYSALLDYLKHLRAYLYTGTQPASYTLGLIEAMLSGVPVVSIGPESFGWPTLFEGHEIAGLSAETADDAQEILRHLLEDAQRAREASAVSLSKARALFDVDVIGPQWASLLGAKVAVAA